MRDFECRLALVTGAAPGFGLAVVRRLAEGGARLVLTDRDDEALTAASNVIGKAVHRRVTRGITDESLWDRMAPELAGLSAPR